jgi:hypothetical protein
MADPTAEPPSALSLTWPPLPPEDVVEDGRVVLALCVDPRCSACPSFAYHWHSTSGDE